MNRHPKWTAVVVAVLALVAGMAWATETNFWSNGANGNWGNPGCWSLGYVPTNDVEVWFTNAAAGAYTVTFDQSATAKIMRVKSDKVTFDLAGKRWSTTPYSAFSAGSGGAICQNAGETATVVFSSSSLTPIAGGNYVNLAYNTATYGEMTWGAGATIYIDDSLGTGIVVALCRNLSSSANVTISGAGSVLTNGANVGGTRSLTRGRWNLLNGGKWFDESLIIGDSGRATVTVHNATAIFTGGLTCGNFGRSLLVISNSTLTVGGTVLLGKIPGGSGGFIGDMLIHNSTAVVSRIEVGGYDSTGYNDYRTGRLIVQNGAALTVSNNLNVSGIREADLASVTNTFVLENGTITMGGGTVGGAITNRGFMRLAGTITGAGASRFQFVNEKNGAQTNGVLEIGAGIGTLSMTNGDFTNQGTIRLGFDAAGGDRLSISGGTATIAGTVAVTNTPGFTPKRGSGLKWDFVQADSIVYTASDNITSLMSAYGLTEGSDYAFGVVASGGGQALRLRIYGSTGTVIVVQ